MHKYVTKSLQLVFPLNRHLLTEWTPFSYKFKCHASSPIKSTLLNYELSEYESFPCTTIEITNTPNKTFIQPWLELT